MLDFPASGQALWSLFDQGGPRPEYVLPMLYGESGFNPAIQNSLGYSGLNQISASQLQAMGIAPSDYLTWPASRQISQVVSRYILSKPGPLRSATRLEQANFLPATLTTATSLSSVISRQGDPYYAANAGFDTSHKGTITVQDIANFVARAANTAAVKNAIANTYALRPEESPHDPVYGEDFGMSVSVFSNTWVVASGIVGIGLAAAWAIHTDRIRV